MIDVYLVNLPQTIAREDFIEIITEESGSNIFDTKTIQYIIDYKWDTYSRNFFKFLFIEFLIFLFAFCLESFIFIIKRSSDTDWTQNQDTHMLIFNLSLKAVCFIYLLRVGHYEFVSMAKQGVKAYFSEFFNLGD